MEEKAFISLGSNLGDGPAALARALGSLGAAPELHPDAVSSLYLTEPQGYAGQPFFTNQVAAFTLRPGLSPHGLLDMLQRLEKELGRKRGEGPRFGPRSIDLDLLLFGARHMAGERLTLPHPRMLERAFVLVPLAEIAPGLALPQGLSVNEALARIRFTMRGNTIFQTETGRARPA